MLKSTLRRFLREEKGTAVVLLAIAMSVLVGFVALVTDCGMIYANRAIISNTIDSAVLAGIQELPGDPQGALHIAGEYARANGLDDGEFSFEVSDNNRRLTGTARREVNMFFARAMGINSTGIDAQAGARVAPITGASNLAPFGVREENFRYGQEITLKVGGGQGCHGNYGALQLNPNKKGAQVYYSHIVEGYKGCLNIGDTRNVEPGNMSGKTKQGVDQRINGCNHVPRCTINSYVEGCSRICIVPVGIWNDAPGRNGEFTVTGFAAFLLDDAPGNGCNNQVKGHFIHYVTPGTTGDTGTDYGLYGTQLIE